MSSKRRQLVLYRMCCCLWVFLGNDKVCTYMETLSRGTWLMVCAMCLQVFFGVETLWAQDARLSEKHIRFQDVDRLYYLYMPDTLAQGNPLVVMLHGYGGNAAGLRPEMIETAARHGFALCIPQGDEKIEAVSLRRRQSHAGRDELPESVVLPVHAPSGKAPRLPRADVRLRHRPRAHGL